MPDIRDTIKKQKAFYESVVSVESPLLNETVYFRSEGFFHLIHKANGKRRPMGEQYMKLMCLSEAPDIIKNSTKIIETRQDEISIKGKKKTVTSYEMVDGKKRGSHIAVIITRIGTGKLKFRSVKKITKKRYSSKKAP